MGFYEWQDNTLVLDPGYFAFDHPVLAINKQKAQIGQMGQDTTGTVGGITMNNLLLGLGGLAGGYLLAKVFLGGEKGISRNPSDLDNEFFEAVRNEDLRNVKALMYYRGADPSKNEYKALRYASRYGLSSIVKEILKYMALWEGSDANSRGATAALKMACEVGNVRIVKMLLDYGVKPVTYQSYQVPGEVVGVLTETLKALIKAKKDNAVQTWHNIFEIMFLLLKNGADVNENMGQPLIVTIRGGDYYRTVMLLELGADVHIQHDKPIQEAKNGSDRNILDIVMEYAGTSRTGKILYDKNAG